MFDPTFNIIIYVLWLAAAVFDYAEYLYYWQLKWYMWSRYKDFLSTEQGRDFVFRKSFLLRTVFAILIYFISLDSVPLLKYILVGFFSADILFLFGYRYIKKKLRRPIFTTKATLILLLTLGFEASVIILSQNWHLFILLLIIRLFFMGVIAMLMEALTTQIKNRYISRKAEKKLKQYKNLTIVGITGSYGKTTVKELTAQLLSYKLTVIKTPQNTNSDIGISRFILKTDFSDADIFIVEMGAYVKGDLKLHCSIVHPTIGILTAINAQHLSMYNSIKEIQDTKYDLLRCLPKSGLAIVNSDNAYCREYLHELAAQVTTFGTEDEYHPTLLIEDLKQKKEGIYAKGRLQWEGKTYHGEIQTKLYGEHMAMNVAPAIILANYLGFSRSEVQKAIEQLVNPENALQTYHYGNATIIDDSYNSNPDGFRAALQILNRQPSEKKRIVITRGMLELGEESDELHAQIGGEISFVADELILITPDFVEALSEGVVGKYKTQIHVKTDPQDLLEYIQQYRDQDVSILLENRIPSIIKKEILAHKKNIS